MSLLRDRRLSARRGIGHGKVGFCLAAILLLCGSVGADVLTVESPERLIPTKLHFDLANVAPPDASADTANFRPERLVIPDSRGSAMRFYDTHLLPRLNRQFASFAAHQNVPGAGEELGEFMMFDDIRKNAERRALKGTTKALRDFVIESVPLDRIFDSLPGGGLRSEAGRSRRSMRFSVGVSHGKPRVGVRYNLGPSLMRFSLEFDGSVGLEYKRSMAKRTRIYCGYDAREHEYDLSYRYSF